MARILLIEDDAGLIELIKLIFDKKAPDLDIIVAQDGETALEMIEKETPELILLDLMLPGNIDGFELCSKLRKLPQTPNIPIIMMTALSQVGAKRKGYESGADYYLTKPFDSEVLIDLVRQHLELVARNRLFEHNTFAWWALDRQLQKKHDTGGKGFAAGIPRVSVIVPTLNEADNLPHVLPWIPDWVSEIILVDGHSTDGTIEVALCLRPDIKIVLQKGRGKGDALKEGFSAATGDIIVMIDGDGSTDPTEIPAFVGALLAGAEFAKGSRFLQGGGTRDMPLYRQLGNMGFVFLVRLLFGGKYTDLLYGYNAFWSRVLPLIQVDTEGFEVETMMNIRALRAGLRIAEVPSWEAERLYGDAKLRAIPDGWRVLKTLFDEFRDHRIKHENLARKGAKVTDRVFVSTVGDLFRQALDLWRSRNQHDPEVYKQRFKSLRDMYHTLLEQEYIHHDDKLLLGYYLKIYGEQVPWAFAENGGEAAIAIEMETETEA